MTTPAPILPPVMATAAGSWAAMPRRFLTPTAPSVAPFQHSAIAAMAVRKVAEMRLTGRPPCGAPSGGGEELLAGSREKPSAYANLHHPSDGVTQGSRPSFGGVD